MIGAKRNLACEQVRGELVVHWDDDDWSAPRRLRYQVETFQTRPRTSTCRGLRTVFFCDPATGQAWRYEYPAGRRAPGSPDTSFAIDKSCLWQGQPKRVGALLDSSFYVALVHPGNTSRKKFTTPGGIPSRRGDHLAHGVGMAALGAESS